MGRPIGWWCGLRTTMQAGCPLILSCKVQKDDTMGTLARVLKDRLLRENSD